MAVAAATGFEGQNELVRETVVKPVLSGDFASHGVEAGRRPFSAESRAAHSSGKRLPFSTGPGQTSVLGDAPRMEYAMPMKY